MTSISSTAVSVTSSSILPLDTNGDGVVSASELAAAEESGTKKRTQDPTVGVDNAAFGASSQLTGILFQFMTAEQSSDAGVGDDQRPSASDLFASMDADGDGVVTQEEFLAARPDDMSEDMASQLFSDIDSEGTGSITAEQFTTAMEARAPMGPPPASEGDADDETTDVADVLNQISWIIDQYKGLVDDIEAEKASGETV